MLSLGSDASSTHALLIHGALLPINTNAAVAASIDANSPRCRTTAAPIIRQRKHFLQKMRYQKVCLRNAASAWCLADAT
jgi:hypothetical protein